MKKKVFGLVIVSILILALFVGCSASSPSSTSQTSEETSGLSTNTNARDIQIDIIYVPEEWGRVVSSSVSMRHGVMYSFTFEDGHVLSIYRVTADRLFEFIAIK